MDKIKYFTDNSNSVIFLEFILIVFKDGDHLNIKYNDFKLNTIALSHELINVIHLDEYMIVELTESPSTGYCWFYTMSDSSIISLEEKKIYDFNKPNIIGGTLQIVWKFKCLNPGECKIHFSYYKSWKNESSPLDKYTYVIKIEL